MYWINVGDKEYWDIAGENNFFAILQERTLCQTVSKRH